MADARAQAKKSCQVMVTNKQLAAMPAARPQLVMCYCILGDKPNALRLYATLTDENQRKAAVQLCTFQGTPLE